MVAMTSSRVTPGRLTATRQNRLSPATMMLTHLILVCRFVMPYALPIGAFACFVYAGFLFNPIAGFVVLGACLIYTQIILQNTFPER